MEHIIAGTKRCNSDAHFKTKLNNEIFQMRAPLSLSLLDLSLRSKSWAPSSLILLPFPLFHLTETGESHRHPQILPNTPADPPIRISCWGPSTEIWLINPFLAPPAPRLMHSVTDTQGRFKRLLNTQLPVTSKESANTYCF